ncbi:MAG: urease accessory protein UreH domain-containing protein [Minisyncoccota bacterium]
MGKITLNIKGMHCRSCELMTEEELRAVSGVKDAKTNFRSGTAEVFYEEVKPDALSLEKAVQRAGYTLGQSKRQWVTSDTEGWVGLLFAIGITAVLYFFAQAFGLFTLSLGSAQRLESLPFVLLLGMVAGFSTCMAMIGGLVLAIVARYSERHPEVTVRQKFLPNVYFNIGRVGGFAVFGGLLGWFGSILQLSSLMVGVMTVFVGGVMLFIGVQLLELFPRLSAWKLMLPKSIARVLGIQAHTKKEYSHSRAIAIGVLTFFLPCGFTQAVQLYVVTVGSPLIGALTMGAFALGTVPGLLSIGGIVSIVQGSARGFFFKTAGVAVIALGVLNFQNGTTLVKLGAQSFIKSGTVLTGGVVGDVQVIRITQTANGYSPDELTVKKGRPVKLIIDSQDSYTCASTFNMPKMGIQETLSPGENVFTFVPEKSGPIPFSCSMGMFRGTMHVVE